MTTVNIYYKKTTEDMTYKPTELIRKGLFVLLPVRLNSDYDGDAMYIDCVASELVEALDCGSEVTP